MYRCAIAFNGRSSDGSERRWASFPVCLYWCAIWLVSMLAFMLVSVLRLVDSVSLLCTFYSFSCMDWFHSKTGMFSMSGCVIVSFPCRNCFPSKDGVFSMPGGNSAWLKLKSCEILCVRQF